MNPRSTPKEVPANKLYRHWNQVPPENWRWPNFSPEEIASNVFVKGKNGPKVKGPILVDARSMDMLQALRTKLRAPLIVNSAYRDPQYNADIGGASHSYHTKGMAFDISMANHNPVEFERAAVEVGFRGIGHYPGDNFMHIDTRQTQAVVRFQGTGKNAKWFSAHPEDNGERFTPPPAEAPATVLNSILKPEILVPVGTAVGASGLAPAAAGTGPFAWALGAILVIAAASIAGFMILRYRHPKIGD